MTSSPARLRRAAVVPVLGRHVRASGPAGCEFEQTTTAVHVLRSDTTPAGFERPRTSVKPGEDRSPQRDSEKAEAVSLSLRERDGRKIARLALQAIDVVRSGDLHRAVELLETINQVCSEETWNQGKAGRGVPTRKA